MFTGVVERRLAGVLIAYNSEQYEATTKRPSFGISVD